MVRLFAVRDWSTRTCKACGENENYLPVILLGSVIVTVAAAIGLTFLWLGHVEHKLELKTHSVKRLKWLHAHVHAVGQLWRNKIAINVFTFQVCQVRIKLEGCEIA